ncbi:alkylated DNA repair dioxygenase AlkB [Pedobacter sp. UYP30]|uniref:alpha-ketoglutarate-dependent dioxygenase AlkB family protein n=1 Tax=Pedobacter sp. UYP30 TaxID=1756400 RepID=UPI003396AB3A
MKLFDEPIDSSKNLLPFDGEVNYYGQVFSLQKATELFDSLAATLAWQHDEALIMGKRIITKRKVAWYGDKPYEYTYSKTTKTALNWIPELLGLKKTIELITGAGYNSCLANLYHTGEEGMAYHSDNEKDLAEHAAIASLSFGAARRFLFKHKDSKKTITTFLEPGSLLVMKGETQKNWLHRLPPTTKTTRPRINLTFRKIS